MATTTSIIFIGHAHQNHSGIIPTHFIQLIENDKPALILQSIDMTNESIVVTPTIESIVDDIYLMIACYVLCVVKPSKDIHSHKRESIKDILFEDERLTLYQSTLKAIQNNNIKLVFNILDGSVLLNKIEEIKNFPNDFEITLPTIKKEFDTWSNSIITKGI